MGTVAEAVPNPGGSRPPIEPVIRSASTNTRFAKLTRDLVNAMTTHMASPKPNRFEEFKRDEEARRGETLTNREIFWSFMDHGIHHRGRPASVPRGVLHRAADECLAKKGKIVPSLISATLARKAYSLDERHVQRSLAVTSGMALEQVLGVQFEDPKRYFSEGRLPSSFIGE